MDWLTNAPLFYLCSDERYIEQTAYSVNRVGDCRVVYPETVVTVKVITQHPISPSVQHGWHRYTEFGIKIVLIHLCICV